MTSKPRDLQRAVSSGGESPDARRLAVDPTHNLVLEASAGTGKTTVLVERYLNLLRAGVDPSNVLAITFTRKAAVEMRARIFDELRDAAKRSEEAFRHWRRLRDRPGDVAITTIDAFCLSLLREFPLEADLDPGFGVADETEVPRLMAQALDRVQRVIGGLALRDEGVSLLLTLLDTTDLRRGLERLLRHRLVASGALRRFLSKGPRSLTLAQATGRVLKRLRDLFQGESNEFDDFLASGPTGHPRFKMLAADLRRLPFLDETEQSAVRSLLDRLAEHLLTRGGRPRRRVPYTSSEYPSVAARGRHLRAIRHFGSAFADVTAGYRRDVGVIIARGVRRIYRVAEREYRRTLRAHAVLDFTDIQVRALHLLRQMDEFSQSRYRLESRYHHILVDEFQDTSRTQWELVSLLVQSWGEGLGIVQDAPLPPSIFVVGDRKQSIYRFRDADVSLFQEAGNYIAQLRPAIPVRAAISRSFRALPELLRFVNDLCGLIDKRPQRSDAFRYEMQDRFPLAAGSADPDGDDAVVSEDSIRLGLALGETEASCAGAIAAEIDRLMTDATVRDPRTGARRAIRPDDIAILFRSRISHREYERALSARGLLVYVDKGLGFFDAEEIQDLRALIRFLADPSSDLWAAAFLRSGIAGLSDEAVRAMAPNLASVLTSINEPVNADLISTEERERFELVRIGISRWLKLVDWIPPAELIDRVLNESAYLFETRGARARQARENVKKMRGLLRRIQNRGYVTLSRIADHIDQLSVGGESNAVIDAAGAVHLMTIHAAKGLEFPIVFVVGLSRGVGGTPPPIQVIPDRGDGMPLVTIWGARLEVENDERARDVEETKRLLYVAITRARDALYLGFVRRDGRVLPGRNSLAKILPKSLIGRVEAISGTPRWVDWSPDGRTGAPHRFRICERVESLRSVPVGRVTPPIGPPTPDDDFSPWPN
ncbi:MAG: UvrD-helicase domain-containing protein [Acidobacteriota bacterium]|nr:UvrD-helicase domain-containing protein [Acidobacteriota bacterium]